MDHMMHSGFMPHGHCYLWQPGLIWTHVISDALIGIAYFSISLSLYGLIRKIKLPFSTMLLSFGVFIGACGITHLMEVWNLWKADYWAAAFIKVLTAIASVATGLWLIKLKPAILAFAENAKLSEMRRSQLEILNVELLARGSELERTNKALAEQQRVLAHSARMSALGEMAGGIAHEINSPLGIITIRANQLERLLQRNTLTPEQIQSEARLIVSTAKRIGDIIKGLRAFAREGENDPFEMASIATIVQDVLVLCQTKFMSSAIDLKITQLPAALMIQCRPVQIGQVILNLLNNAYDAVAGLTESWVTISVHEVGDDLEIAVTDSGLGISSEIQTKMMQPFFTTKEVGKGTGLGLSISKGIIETHHGTLYLDTDSPNTRFVVRLPKNIPTEKTRRS